MGTFSSKPSQEVPPPGPFDRLPYEIRSQIWLETIPPRVIGLNPHPKVSSPDSNTFCSHLAGRSQPTRSHNPTLTPSELSGNEAQSIPPDNLEFIWPSKTFKGHIYTHFEATRPFLDQSTDPPAALLVCKDSRAIALRNGYRLAFEGHTSALEGKYKAFWDTYQLREKGVWVNFDRDLIMLDIHWENPFPGPIRTSIEPLHLLSKFAPAEVSRIRYLGLGGDKGPRLVKAWCGPHASGHYLMNSRSESIHDWLLRLGFESLEEVWVDDDYGETAGCTWVGAMR